MRAHAFLFLATLVVAGLRPAAADVIMIDLFADPSTPVNTGQTVNLEVVFSGLDNSLPTVPNIVTAYALVVTFDPMVFTPSGISYLSSNLLDSDPFGLAPPYFTFTEDSLNDPGGSLNTNHGGPGRFAFSELSFDSDADLKTLQGDASPFFNAVTISFEALQDAATPSFGYVYDIDSGLDVKGAGGIPYEIASIPVPGTLILILAAIIPFAASRRVRRPLTAE